MIRPATICLTAAAFALAGCGGSIVPPSSTPAPPARTGDRPAPNAYRGAAQPHASAAAAGTLAGRSAAELVRQFGPARLDMHEGTARKLQFAGDRCVLDAYLYPPRSGAEPVVAHVDTRTPDGADTDRAACIAALSR